MISRFIPRFSFKSYGGTVTVAALIFCICICPILQAFPQALTDNNDASITTEGTDSDPNILPRETCQNGFGYSFIKHFPNSDNCNAFWTCVEKGDGIPKAIQESCPTFTDARSGLVLPLVWNFVKCHCDYPWNSECYDPQNDDHYAYRYNCAEMIDPVAKDEIDDSNFHPSDSEPTTQQSLER